MASTHIEITGTASRTASQFRYFVDKMKQIQDEYGNLKAVMEQISFGGDYPSLAGSLGITEAEASTVFAIFASMDTEINGAFTNQLVSRCG